MHKFSFIPLLLLMSGCAIQEPMMANGERCKPTYYTEQGRLMTCDEQKRDLFLATSLKEREKAIEEARRLIKEGTAGVRKRKVECDKLIITSDGEEICVMDLN